MLIKSAPARSAQRGLSLVELMVGIAVGLFVVAAAATLVTSQLVENRRLMLEVQVQQDLRATADIITRELRRAGSWPGVISSAVGSVWSPGTAAQVNTNFNGLSPASGVDDEVVYRSSRTSGSNGPYTFVLDGGVIKTQLAPGVPMQQLTDGTTLVVTQFAVTAVAEPGVVAACTKLCDDGPPQTTNCWPSIAVRSFVVEITGHAATDASVVRSIRSVVRLRNDEVQFSDPAQICPP